MWYFQPSQQDEGDNRQIPPATASSPPPPSSKRETIQGNTAELQITVLRSSYLIMTFHKLAKNLPTSASSSTPLWAKVKNHVWQCCGKCNWFHSDCVSSKHRQYWWCCTVILLGLDPTEHWSLSTHYSSIRGILVDWSCQKLLMCLTNHCSAVGRQIRVLHGNCCFFPSPRRLWLHIASHCHMREYNCPNR